MRTNLLSGAAAAPVGVSRRTAPAGTILDEADGRHLIVVHASRATWTTCRADGSRHLRRRGHVDVIPAGTTGGFVAASPCTSLILSLAPDVFDATLGAASILAPRHMLERPRIVRLAAALQGTGASGNTSDRLFLDAMARALASQLMDLAEPQPERRGATPQRIVDRVRHLIDARLDERLTIDTLAREAGASSSSLRSWFKEAMGVSVHHYVMQRRVARARLLLEQGNLAPSQVALAAGFAHQSHMARWMRRELGQAPSALRRHA